MRIVYLGSGVFGCESLRWLVAAGHSVPLVITQPAKPSGRGRKTNPTPIYQLAQSELGLPCLESGNVNTKEVVEKIRELAPDIILIIAFGQKVGTELLSLPETHVINLHASILPKYRGAAPINWAILNGDTESGLTLFSLTEAWDAGAIWGSLKVPIDPNETASELHDRLAQQGPQLLEEVLDKIAGQNYTPEIQEDQLATRAPKLKKSDGSISWSSPASSIHNLIRGMWTWPGAYCQYQQEGGKPQRITIARAEIAGREPATGLHPGTILDSMCVLCGDGNCLKLLEVKPDNSRLMPFVDFVHGRRVRPGDSMRDGTIASV
jgi:methionyl-tRNA formyltransferase